MSDLYPIGKTHTHLGCYGIITRNQHIALIRKGRGPYKGRYDLPGGTPDFGESPEETVIREIREETGIHVQHTRLLYADSAVFPYSQEGESCTLHHLGLIFECRAGETILSETGDGLDSEGGVWIKTTGNADGILTPFAENAVRYLRKTASRT